MSWKEWFKENIIPMAAVIIFLVVLVGVALLLRGIIGFYSGSPYSLSALALSGVIVLLGALLVFTTLVKAIGLSAPDQPLGLPEGSVRALLALALLGLFAILVSSVLNPNHEEARTFRGLREGDVTALIKNNPDARDIVQKQQTDSPPTFDVEFYSVSTTGRLREADVDASGYVDDCGYFFLFRDNISKNIWR
jgi:hypothetical protein